MLYMAFTILLDSVLIGTGVGFAYGMKDVSVNMAEFIQVNEIVSTGGTISTSVIILGQLKN